VCSVQCAVCEAEGEGCMRQNLETSNMGLFSELELGICMEEIFSGIYHTRLGRRRATRGGSGMGKYAVAHFSWHYYDLLYYIKDGVRV